ncbi:MAG: hypothetical protein HYX63_13530 [Gammaproteobacteria bacterium]|nr:hypothetical protein [Gammaproteobacteria bacterium]
MTRVNGPMQALVMPDHARLIAGVVIALAERGFTVRAFWSNPRQLFVQVEHCALCDAIHGRGDAAWYRIERTERGSLYTYRWQFEGVAVEWQQLNPELH